MKLAFTPILAFFVLLFVYTKLVGPIPFSLNSVVTNKMDMFSVTGEGKASVVPDIAVVSVGVSAQGATAKAVQQELNTKMNAVTAAVKAAGIKEADIKTADYSINPTYDYQSATQKITGYQAQSNLTIKVRDMDRANSVLDAATAAGANQVRGVSFTVDDPTRAEDQARTEAVAQAKKKAEDAAKTAGFKLGRIVNYQEGVGGSPIPMAMYDSRAALSVEPEMAPTQVSPGSTEVMMTVTLTYQLD
jgi:uncharacterized protein YggE